MLQQVPLKLFNWKPSAGEYSSSTEDTFIITVAFGKLKMCFSFSVNHVRTTSCTQNGGCGQKRVVSDNDTGGLLTHETKCLLVYRHQ